METRNIVISANGMATLTAVERWMRISGGPLINNIAPSTIATVPPMPRTPCEVNFASRTNRATDRISNATPAQLMGRIDKAESPSSARIPPATPGKINPGEENST